MENLLLKEISTELNSFELYTIFKDEQYSFFLDSGMDHKKLGEYSFIGADPFLVFKSKDEDIEITRDGETVKISGNPFEKIKEILGEFKMDYKSEIPFVGGAVGYLSYDLCHHIENLPRTAVDDVDVPDMYFGLYDGVVCIDHRGEKDRVYVASLGIVDSEQGRVEQLIEKIKTAEMEGVSIELPESTVKKEFKSNFTRDEFVSSVRRVQDYIKSGDIYQANLTQRYSCDLEESPYELYGKLREINPAPFASFMDFGEGHIVSSSPERFIKLRDNIIETRPIKGTRPRGKNAEEDKKYREELMGSEKDKAELLMIVDLERNDLGKIAKTGTVEVTELFKLEEYSTVYHLVSTVVAEVREDCDVVDCIIATFPGGSITGAPKIRAMEVIDELEPTQRNIYTGSIGYIGFNGDMDLNIVIRTVVCKDDKAYFQVGGGMTWDSDAEMEYQETLDKAKALMDALNR